MRLFLMWPGSIVVDWVYTKQIGGRLKWLPNVGEVSGFSWMVILSLSFWLGLIGGIYWLVH